MLTRLKGPPYPPQGAGLGGQPTNKVDTPIIAVLLVFFVASAALNMVIFQRNRRKGHKFVLSALLFGFSMARISANVMRIVWANYPRNASIAIAANVLTNAGVLLLFVVNLILAQRILRAYQPRLGWSKPASLAFKILYCIVVALLVMVIVSVVYSFFTLDTKIHQQLRDIQLFAVTFLVVMAGLPIPIVGIALVLPRKERTDYFGTGSMRTKIILVLFTTFLLALGAGFRAGVAYQVRPANDPAWFDHKACFYCFNFVIELIVVFSYAFSRFDRRFHIPDGSNKPGDYSRGAADNAAEDKNVPVDEERGRTSSEQRQQEQKWETNLRSELDRRESMSQPSQA